mmetsp:Transcript_89062/g.236591  ORF Transcript_89062/g.236591 Transcript_89062/m.236591 type:complete len:225 (-) Transcript_89062:132-806(-)
MAAEAAQGCCLVMARDVLKDLDANHDVARPDVKALVLQPGVADAASRQLLDVREAVVRKGGDQARVVEPLRIVAAEGAEVADALALPEDSGQQEAEQPLVQVPVLPTNVHRRPQLEVPIHWRSSLNLRRICSQERLGTLVSGQLGRDVGLEACKLEKRPSGLQRHVVRSVRMPLQTVARMRQPAVGRQLPAQVLDLGQKPPLLLERSQHRLAQPASEGRAKARA